MYGGTTEERVPVSTHSVEIYGDRELLSPDRYAQGYPHDVWARLRRKDPVHRVEEWGGEPYWAITRQREVIQISKSPELFQNAGKTALLPYAEDPQQPIRTIIDMDPPEHRDYRSLISKKFTPRALASLEQHVDTISASVLDRIGDGERRLDFVESIASPLPIWVIAEMLGAPDSCRDDLFRWTNESVGATDPEFQKGRSAADTRASSNREMFEFFQSLAEQRRRDPRDDLTSLLVNATIAGKAIPEHELLSYFVILVAAGNETTRNATSGGMLALMDHPDQMELLRANPKLIDGFVEETLRFCSPVIHMCRTAAADTILGDKSIRAGDRLVMFYPSANRDEAVFDDPDAFRITRNPNRHLAFGVGEHVCLGSHVARMELRSIFKALLDRLEDIELIGAIDRLRMTSVGGIKRLPVRCKLRKRS